MELETPENFRAALSNSPLKIEIAWAGWSSNTFYAPNKHLVITEWLLSALLGAKGRNGEHRMLLFDQRYWSLLAELVRHHPGKVTDTTWLLPLFLRYPLIPIVTDFLHMAIETPENVSEQVFDSLHAAVGPVWHLATQKCTVEVLSKCFFSCLSFLRIREGHPKMNAPLVAPCSLFNLVRLVSESFMHECEKVSSIKKIHATFLHQHLDNWLLSAQSSRPEDMEVCKSIREAVMAVVFHVDILKSVLNESSSWHELVDNLRLALPSSRPYVLSALPDLLRSYFTALQHHRASLFPSSSVGLYNAVPRNAYTAGGDLGRLLVLLLDDQEDPAAWKARYELLLVAKQDVVQTGEYSDMWKDIIMRAQACLQYCDSSAGLQCSRFALLSLSCAANTNYANIKAHLPPIFRTMLSIPDTLMDEAVSFLLNALDYHAKTRTLLDLFVAILDGFKLASPSSENRSLVAHDLLAGPFFSRRWLPQLLLSLKNFLTAGQVDPLITAFNDALLSCETELIRATRQSPVNEVEAERHAGSLLAIVQLYSLLLPNLPMQVLPTELSDKAQSQISRSLTRVVRLDVSEAGSLWVRQLVAAAALRCCYLLACSVPLLPAHALGSLFLDLPHHCIGALHNFAPEVPGLLLFESGRCNLANMRHDGTGLRRVLVFLRLLLAPLHWWSGKMSDFLIPDSGPANAAVALWHVLLETFLDDIEEFAEGDDIKMLIELIFNQWHLQAAQVHETGFDPMTRSRRLLMSASFWESPRLSSALVSHLVTHLQPLESFQQKGSSLEIKRPYSSLFTTNDNNLLTSMDMLLRIPLGYLERVYRKRVAVCALHLDLLLESETWNAESASLDHETWCNRLRLYATRVISTTGLSDVMAPEDHSGFSRRLVFSATRFTSQVLWDSTIQLLSCICSQSSRDTTWSPTSVLQDYCDLLVSSEWEEMSRATQTLVFEILCTSINNLSDNSDRPHWPNMLSNVTKAISDRLTVYMTRRAMDTIAEESTRFFCSIMRLWCAITRLQPTGLPLIDMHSITEPALPERLSILTLLPSAVRIYSRLEKYHSLWAETILEFIITEKSRYIHNQGSYIEHFVVAFVLFARIQESVVLLFMQRKIRRLDPKEFQVLLELLPSHITDQVGSERDLGSVLQLSVEVLRNAPEGTSLASCAHMREIMQSVMNINAMAGDTQSMGHILDWFVYVCKDKAATLSIQDIGCVWSMLANIMAPATVHDMETDLTVCHRIVDVVGSLVKFAQDLVLLTLPQLVTILRRLMRLFICPRHQLGGSQARLVADRLPRWINSSRALGKDEARAVARLLVSLQTKNVVRRSKDVDKAVSLSRPLTMHAPYILMEYLEIANDVLLGLPTDVREELQPGIFVLCDISSIHARDAMMAGLVDAGQKATLKALWQEYEKQKYAGEG